MDIPAASSAGLLLNALSPLLLQAFPPASPPPLQGVLTAAGMAPLLGILLGTHNADLSKLTLEAFSPTLSYPS